MEDLLYSYGVDVVFSGHVSVSTVLVYSIVQQQAMRK
jgi:hypothetical protein